MEHVWPSAWETIKKSLAGFLLSMRVLVCIISRTQTFSGAVSCGQTENGKGENGGPWHPACMPATPQLLSPLKLQSKFSLINHFANFIEVIN